MNVRYDQAIFRANWNLIANIVESKTNMKLPTLSDKGNCEGLSLTLFAYFSRDQEEEFYDLYHWVCTEKPETFANLITTYFTQKLYNSKMEKLFTFVAEVKTLQDKYLISPMHGLNDKSQTDQYNFKRIGKLNKHESIFYPRHAGQIENAIKNTPMGGARMILMGTETSHALCIYRTIPKEVFLYDKYVFPSKADAEQYRAYINNNNNSNNHDIITIKDNKMEFWFGFDPNDGQRRGFANPADLAKYLMRSANINFHPIADQHRSITDISSTLPIFSPVKYLLSWKLSNSIQNVSDTLANNHFWMTVTEDETMTKAEAEAEDEAKSKILSSHNTEDKIGYLLLSEKDQLEALDVLMTKELKNKPSDDQLLILENLFERVKNNTKNNKEYVTKSEDYGLPSFLYNNSINQKQREHLRLIKKVYFNIVSEVLNDRTMSSDYRKKIIEKVSQEDNLIHYPLEFKGITTTGDSLRSLISRLNLEEISDNNNKAHDKKNTSK